MGNNNRRNWGKEKRWQDLLKKHLKILYWPSTREREREYAGDPERARRVNLARSGIQSKCRIRFIFPARGFSHKMEYNTTDLILRGQYLLPSDKSHGSCGGPLSVSHYVYQFSPAYQSIFHPCFLFCVSALLTDPNKYTTTSTVQNKTVLQRHKVAH